MRPKLLLRELEQVKVLADPLRLRIIEELRAEPLSPRQMADRLGVKPTRLYHHFAALERAGLIELASTRPRRGAVERFFRPVARELVVDRRMFAGGGGEGHAGSVLSAASVMFSRTLEELRAQAEAGVLPLEDRDRVEVATARVRIPARELPGLMRRLRELLEAAQAAEGPEGDEWVRITLALFPVTPSEKAPGGARAASSRKRRSPG